MKHMRQKIIRTCVPVPFYVNVTAYDSDSSRVVFPGSALFNRHDITHVLIFIVFVPWQSSVHNFACLPVSEGLCCQRLSS